MNRDQFFNKHQNLQIQKAELERKYRVFLREQEEMRMMQNMAMAKNTGGAGQNGPVNILPENCIEFVVDTTNGTYFGMSFVSTGEPITFTIDWGDGTTENGSGYGGYYQEEHTYPEENSLYIVRMCFDDPAKILQLDFYGDV
jgi:hypothetical protein